MPRASPTPQRSHRHHCHEHRSGGLTCSELLRALESYRHDGGEWLVLHCNDGTELSLSAVMLAETPRLRLWPGRRWEVSQSDTGPGARARGIVPAGSSGAAIGDPTITQKTIHGTEIGLLPWSTWIVWVVGAGVVGPGRSPRAGPVRSRGAAAGSGIGDRHADQRTEQSTP